MLSDQQYQYLTWLNPDHVISKWQNPDVNSDHLLVKLIFSMYNGKLKAQHIKVLQNSKYLHTWVGRMDMWNESTKKKMSLNAINKVG